MKKLLFIIPLCTLLALCSCKTNNGGSTTESVNTDKVSVSELYNGIEDIQGKAYKKFTMPEKITKNECNDVYNLTLGYSNEKQDLSQLTQKGEKLVTAFSEKSLDDSKGLLVDNFRYDYTDNDFYCDVDMYDGFSATLNSNENINDEVTDFELYNIPREDNAGKSYNLKTGTMTAQQAAEFADKFMVENLKDFTGDLLPQTKYVCAYNSESADCFHIVAEYTYEGIPLDMNLSPFFPANNNDLVYYLDTVSDMKISSADSIESICANSNYVVKKADKIEKLISLQDAVNILDDQLAENSSYNFSDCELMYCHINHQQGQNEVVNPDDIVIDTTITYDFSPVWCFYIQKDCNDLQSLKSPDTIRVDALSGEVTFVKNG